jgi:hypothetical protein
MGKAALLIVAAFSVAGGTLMYTSQQADVKAAQGQGEYQADQIAREIARSAYNAAVGDVNRFTDIDSALAVIGEITTEGCANGVPRCARRTGSMQGGTFLVEASVMGGNAVDIFARGMYGYTGVQNDPTASGFGELARLTKTHEINESYRSEVLQVNPSGRGGLLKIQFVDSQAGYCSAIFLQRTVPGLPADEQPPMEMVYAPGKNRNGARNVGLERYMPPGTQMNFAIGVSTGCNGPASRPNLRFNVSNTLTPSALAAEQLAYTYLASDWNWLHYALDPEELMQGNSVEAPWGMVEVDPNNDQRWRISFEDIHNWNLASNHAQYHDPRYSLWATKKYGYDLNNDGVGDGWRDTKRIVMTPNAAGTSYTVSEVNGQDGFHDLRDTGSPADFSDQVIFVEIVPLAAGSGTDGMGTATP